MIKFKTELQKLRRKFKEGRLLAKESKISTGSMSRMLTGKSLPSLKLLYKVLGVIDGQDASRLLAGYLNEQIQGPLRERVSVCIREGEASQCCDPLALKIQALRPEVRSHLEVIIEELLNPGSEHSPVIHLSRKHRRK